MYGNIIEAKVSVKVRFPGIVEFSNVSSNCNDTCFSQFYRKKKMITLKQNSIVRFKQRTWHVALKVEACD